MNKHAIAVEKYRSMWTCDLWRYAIVQKDPERPYDCVILDVQSDMYVVIEEDREVMVLLFDHLRRAGATTLSPDEVGRS